MRIFHASNKTNYCCFANNNNNNSIWSDWCLGISYQLLSLRENVMWIMFMNCIFCNWWHSLWCVCLYCWPLQSPSFHDCFFVLLFIYGSFHGIIWSIYCSSVFCFGRNQILIWWQVIFKVWWVYSLLVHIIIFFFLKLLFLLNSKRIDQDKISKHRSNFELWHS